MNGKEQMNVSSFIVKTSSESIKPQFRALINGHTESKKIMLENDAAPLTHLKSVKDMAE